MQRSSSSPSFPDVAPRKSASGVGSDCSNTHELRKALGVFLTGVTVVAVRSSCGALHGLTANSFTSVSLAPPLILVCIGRERASYNVLRESSHFAVSILSDQQRSLCELFASRRSDKFGDVEWHEDAFGSPILDYSHAWFSCATYQTVEAGDHLILIARVLQFGRENGLPLGYYAGEFAKVETTES